MILIKDVQIIDGTGAQPYRGDVLIKNDRISAIGTFPAKTAETVIQGTGAYLAPGFIDINTDSDHYLTLFTEPAQTSFLHQGVTTIIGGQCGSSLAPLLYGSLESIRKWADTNAISVDWHSVREFLGVLEHKNLGVNFGTMVGHSTVRRALLGEAFRDLTLNELRVFRRIIETALEEGAFGVSSGLGYAHSRQAPFSELKAILEPLGRSGGVYTTHLRDETEGLIASVSETLRLAEEIGAPTIISHLRALLGHEKDFSFALRLLAEHQSPTPVYFDTYPFNTSIVPIYTLLPRWTQNGGLETMLTHLTTPYIVERILKELPGVAGDDITVLQAPGAEFLHGRTLGAFAADREMDVRRGLLELMRVSNLRAVVVYRNINIDATIQSLNHPMGLIASNSPGTDKSEGTNGNERTYHTFTKFLSVAAERNAIPLQKAVERITSTPARILGLNDRGTITEGKIADLTMFSDFKVSNVFVGGKLAVREGVFQNIFGGKVLKKS